MLLKLMVMMIQKMLTMTPREDGGGGEAGGGCGPFLPDNFGAVSVDLDVHHGAAV